MLEITKAEMASLIQLKENETEKTKVQSVLNALPEKFAAIDAEMTEAEQQFQQRAEKLEEKKKRYRDCESDVQMKQEAIKKSDIKLLSIKSNKEYNAVLKEIDDLKAAISKLEDEMLVILDGIDEEDAAVTAARKEWEQEKARLNGEKKEMEKEQAGQEVALADLNATWKVLAEQVPKALMDHYLEVRGRVAGGNAVAAARNFVCQGCHMNIPPQMYNELHKAKTLRYCPFCHRILYYDGENGATGVPADGDAPGDAAATTDVVREQTEK